MSNIAKISDAPKFCIDPIRFQFTVECKVSIGVSIDIDLWLDNQQVDYRNFVTVHTIDNKPKYEPKTSDYCEVLGLNSNQFNRVVYHLVNNLGGYTKVNRY
jgi:hypothetical protein